MENNKIFWRKVPSVTNLLLCGMFIPVGILHASESYGQRVMIDLTAENKIMKKGEYDCKRSLGANRVSIRL